MHVFWGICLGACQQTPPEPAPPVAQLPDDTWFCAPGDVDTQPEWQCVETTPVSGAERARHVTAPPVAGPAAPAQAQAARPGPVQTSQTTPQAQGAAGDTMPKVRIEDLPPDYYTIQLVAFSERERLQRFAEKYDLWGLTAARVKTDAGVFYVLLWGVYETRAQAEDYLTELPAAVTSTTKPWIRPLGSLQKAMLAAGDQR